MFCFNHERKDMTFQPTATLAYQIARHIGDQIIQGKLKPGERIIEDKLAREMGVSRAPLREAVRALEKDGLVELIPRRGIRVTVLTRAYVAGLYDILTELYSLLVTKLFDCADAKARKKVDTAIGNLERFAEKQDALGYYNGIFDLCSVALDVVGMPLLNRMIWELWPAKRRIEYPIITLRKDDLKQNADLFRQAYQCALAGDRGTSVKAVRAYIQGEKSFALEHLSFES